MKSVSLTGRTLTITALLALMACSSTTNVQPLPMRWELDEQYQLNFPEPSGLTCDKNARVLWSVSDQTGQIYQLSLEGQQLRTLPWKGEDPEGITMVDDMLFVVEEQSGEIVRIDTSGSEISRFLIPNVGAGTNSGLEGIAYNPDSESLLAIREKDPSTWIFLDLFGVEQARQVADFADDYSGVTHAGGSTFWVVSDESKMVFRVDETGNVLESFETRIKKIEGIAVLNDTLYVVSDSQAELYRFVKR
jgi:uncharacterized protein YjiK